MSQCAAMAQAGGARHAVCLCSLHKPARFSLTSRSRFGLDRLASPPLILSITRATSLSLGRAPTLHWPRSCLHALYQRRRVCAESQSCDCPALRGASALIFSSSLLPLGSGAPPRCSCRRSRCPIMDRYALLIRSCSRAKDASPPPATYSLCSPPTARVKEPGAEPPPDDDEALAEAPLDVAPLAEKAAPDAVGLSGRNRRRRGRSSIRATVVIATEAQRRLERRQRLWQRQALRLSLVDEAVHSLDQLLRRRLRPAGRPPRRTCRAGSAPSRAGTAPRCRGRSRAGRARRPRRASRPPA